MAKKIQLKRGNSVDFEGVELLDGEPAVLTDTKELFIGIGEEKIKIGPFEPSGLDFPYSEPLTNGSEEEPSLVFANGDIIMVEVDING